MQHGLTRCKWGLREEKYLVKCFKFMQIRNRKEIDRRRYCIAMILGAYSKQPTKMTKNYYNLGCKINNLLL